MTYFTILKLLFFLPFIFFFPGFFLARLIPIKTNLIERIILAVFLSFVCIFVPFNLLEKIGGKLTPLNIAVTIGIINMLSLMAAYALKRWRQTI